MSGFEVLRLIRLFSSVPVIVLSVKADEKDVFRALESGADDYMVKPFRPLELLARVRAQLRRHTTHDGEAVLTWGNMRFDPSTHQLRYHGRETTVTAIEGRIVEQLMQSAGRIVTHSNLAEALWGDDYPGAVASLRVHIRNLRAKLEDDPRHPKLIVTKPGLGYLLAKPV
jgi:two-component system KDP operon response regulator KdpE